MNIRIRASINLDLKANTFQIFSFQLMEIPVLTLKDKQRFFKRTIDDI